eukprot:1194148-Prorocentrum_minimum.AAC.1
MSKTFQQCLLKARIPVLVCAFPSLYFAMIRLIYGQRALSLTAQQYPFTYHALAFTNPSLPGTRYLPTPTCVLPTTPLVAERQHQTASPLRACQRPAIGVRERPTG